MQLRKVTMALAAAGFGAALATGYQHLDAPGGGLRVVVRFPATAGAQVAGTDPGDR